ncbi:MAG: TrkH family potassium uptake protein [Bacteroidales bacterium]|nr:TrkH family potassium uptake protein [Bacteroidales bacterium]
MVPILNIRGIFKILSYNLFIITTSLLVCVAVGMYYGEEVGHFILSSCLTLLAGFILYIIPGIKKSIHYNLSQKDAFFTVSMTWLIMSLAGCLPYVLSGEIPSFINAFFESMSGFTTTGSSILTDIEALPKSILFWRSLTHWIGGIGIIVLVIIVMPKLQIAGYHLFTMESSLNEKIAPKVRTIGKRLLFIYLFLTGAEIILLLTGGMNLFESACHAFGTIATGGFSPKNSSIGGYSPYIQYIVMGFMILGGTNFIIHYYLLRFKIHKIRNNEEFKFYLLTFFVTGITVALFIFFKMHKPVEESFRESFFQVVSVLTCTGYSTADYLQWPVFAWLLIFLAMFIGGSTGSTAGGIKLARHLVLFKNIRLIFRKLLSPNAVIPIRLNKKTIDEKLNARILSFITIYIIIFITGFFFMVSLGLDIKTAGGSVATCMAGIGPGIGSVGPASNFAHLPDAGKLALSFLMLLGRLEIFPVLILFSRSFWRL